MDHYCRVCGDGLDDDNWYPSYQKRCNYICNECNREYYRLYREANKNKVRDNNGKVCRICKVELDGENWSSSYKKSRHYICKECSSEKRRSYRKNNIEKVKASNTKQRRKNGGLSMSENKECTVYLGVHIGEHVLGSLFENVEMMPYGNKGYDIICNNDKKIDVKISCMRKNYNGWSFSIKHNTITDYFLCMAFNNRKDLNPLHIWMLPEDKFNHLIQTSISESTLDKWSEYEKPIGEAITYCNAMKGKSVRKVLKNIVETNDQ